MYHMDFLSSIEKNFSKKTDYKTVAFFQHEKTYYDFFRNPFYAAKILFRAGAIFKMVFVGNGTTDDSDFMGNGIFFINYFVGNGN